MQSEAPAPPLFSPRTMLVAALSLATAFGLLNATVVLTSDWAAGQSTGIAYALLMELSGAFTFVIVLPIIVWLVRRFPVARDNWWHRIPLHVACSMAVGATHTLLMWGTRTVAFGLLDWGTYDYGVMRFRFVMEYMKQALAYGLTYAVTMFVHFVRQARSRELESAHLARQLTEARLGALKSQLNPHFLFNTLNMISSYVHQDARRADTMIAHLSQFLRDTLRHSDIQEVPLEQELRTLDSYLAIAEARFAERLTVQKDIAPDSLHAAVPHLLLQPLVENAITHGVGNLEAPGRIRIAASHEADRLRLVVEDNGPGLDGDAREALTRGVGLTNTVERLRALYSDRQQLTLLQADEGGLRVVVDVPWRTLEAPAGPGS